jgi:hypothetical protein
MKWPERVSVLGLALVLTLGVSCTTSDGGITGPAIAEDRGSGGEGSGGQSGNSGPGGGTISGIDGGGVLKATDLLTCEAQPYVVSQKTIGPEGGSLTIGRHRLDIPRNALASKVRITGEQVSGSVNSVRLSPEGLRFSKPARLTLDYRNCAAVRVLKRVVYTNELLKILELPRSEDYPKYEYVTGAIDHFSRYAVAY